MPIQHSGALSAFMIANHFEATAEYAYVPTTDTKQIAK